MSHISRQNGRLFVEAIPLSDIAREFGTPCFVYSKAALVAHFAEFHAPLNTHPAGRDALICYAVKANSNLAILQTFAQLGAGFDIVSGGELRRVLKAGAKPETVVFSGVGKTSDELRFALDTGVLCFNIESTPELERLESVAAECDKVARVSFRVNPDVDAGTHPYISTGLRQNKFGVPMADARDLYRRAAASKHLEVTGIDCHIGSQILDIAPFVEALDRVLRLVDELSADGIELHHLDIGGGLGIRYREGQQPPKVADYLAPVLDRLAQRQVRLVLEPGRRLVGNAGVLLTQVEYVKQGEEKQFVIVDAAMNDLMRPSLYDAWHDIEPVEPSQAKARFCDIVGPICETGDFLARDREIATEQGALLAVLSAGAYGMAMSSNYNSRRRAAEVLVDGRRAHLIRQRDRYEDLWANERLIPTDTAE